MQVFHEPLRRAHVRRESRPHRVTVEMVKARLDRGDIDLVMLSAYLNHRPTVELVAAEAASRGVPLILGGPGFSDQRVVAEWTDLHGVSAVFAGESDDAIAGLADTAINGGSLSKLPGVFQRGGLGRVAPPLLDLDALAAPDLSDFPWQRYPNRVVPLMTGRGCGWGICTFCSDVTSANGRTFRTRSVEVVLDEMAEQAERYDATDFIFLDLKLNSDLTVWYGLIDRIQDRVPGARWIATVHVNNRGENGLDAETLRAAHAAGLTRISFGLETGSDRLAATMSKGTSAHLNADFIGNAHAAGISVRSTMMLGYPGETPDDLELTRTFLTQVSAGLDRIKIGRFKAIPGTRFEREYVRRPERFTELEGLRWNHRYARATYRYGPGRDRSYRRLTTQILRIVHRINRKPLREDALQFDGLM